ncbi:MAG: hypothetical protein ACREGJ_03895 [Candidatus Saccharimonadales bacterium]
MASEYPRVSTKRRVLFVVAIAALIFGLLPQQKVGAFAQGDGMVLYGEGTVQTPRSRDWTNSTDTFSAESNLPSIGGTFSQSIMEAAPSRNEIIAGVVTGSTLNILRWNGTSWSSEWTATVGATNTPSYDIVYMPSSGKAMVIYSKNVGASNEIAFRIWDGSSWTSETLYDAQRTSGTVQAIRAEARAGTNEIAVIWADGNFDLSGDYFNGTNSTWSGEPSSALSTNLSKVGSATSITTNSFDLALEQTSGELLVAWGEDAVTVEFGYVTRGVGTGGTWGTVSAATSAGEATDMDLAAEPGGNYIAFVSTAEGAGQGLVAGAWDGSAWGTISELDNSTDAVFAGTTSLSVTWVKSGSTSRAVVAYDDTNAAGVDWFTYDKTSWTSQTDFATAPTPGAINDQLIRLYTNPQNNAEAMLFVTDDNADLFAKKLTFDGTTFTWTNVEPGGVALEDTMATEGGWGAAFTYHQNFSVGSLTVDIVDGSGNPVTSPSLAMSAISSGGSCQTSTGTFGTASEKIRVNNTTAAAPWVLSVAATAGSTSDWSSGTANYDFNDSSGSGCTDGGDSDSLVGQLSINPSGATSTPQAGCTNTGVSLGGSSAFVEGTTNSITLASASSSAATNCYWDFTGIALSQTVPELLPAGTYTIQMTLTVVAN